MLPVPTRAAWWLVAAAVLSGVVGVASSRADLVGLSFALWLVLAMTFALSAPLGRRLRRERLEFAWWLDHGSGAASGSVVAGVPFAIRCFVRHRGAQPLFVSRLLPIVGGDLDVDDSRVAVHFAANSRSEFTFDVCAKAIGEATLHGLTVDLRGPLGLFDTPLYFPNPLHVKVLPRAAALRLRSGAARMPQPVAAGGRSARTQRGGGTDFHELRDFVSGDPFKAIAWKASARRGKLMVREVEQEVQRTTVMVVDTSATMRSGTLGRRKLDLAFDLVAAECRQAIGERDRFGLATFDGRVTSFVPPDESRAQVLRVYDALLAEASPIDEDRTAVDEDELRDIVSRYLKQQAGLDFGLGSKRRDQRMLEHVRKEVGHEGAHVVGPSAASRAFRLFCRRNGLPLAARGDAPQSKTNALADALKRAGARSATPSTLLVLTDMDGIPDIDALAEVLRMVRMHGHEVRFLLPDGRTLFAGPRDDATFMIYSRGEERRLRRARQRLTRLGARTEVLRAPSSPTRMAS